MTAKVQRARGQDLRFLRNIEDMLATIAGHDSRALNLPPTSKRLNVPFIDPTSTALKGAYTLFKNRAAALRALGH